MSRFLDLTPTEGAHIMALVETYRRTLEATELEARVAALVAVLTLAEQYAPRARALPRARQAARLCDGS